MMESGREMTSKWMGKLRRPRARQISHWVGVRPERETWKMSPVNWVMRNWRVRMVRKMVTNMQFLKILENTWISSLIIRALIMLKTWSRTKTVNTIV